MAAPERLLDMGDEAPFMVHCHESGDQAYAEDEEQAVYAARVLAREAREHGCGVRPTVGLYERGKLLRQLTGAF